MRIYSNAAPGRAVCTILIRDESAGDDEGRHWLHLLRSALPLRKTDEWMLPAGPVV